MERTMGGDMHDTLEFRIALRNRLLKIAGLSTIAAIVGSDVGCGPTTGSSTECVAWPDADGAGGGGGSAGGSSGSDACPGVADAARHMTPVCKALSVDGPGTMENGQCCY